MSDSEKSNSRLFDLDLLRAIVTVADCGSFTTAAARLHSTQSTVSQKVRRLEEMAGHRLLERGNRDVLPTDAGDTLLGYARRLLALNDELAEALSGATVALTVRIGVPDDFAAGRTTERLAAFNRRYPQVKLEVTSGMSRDLSASYDRGELDLVLLKQRRASREALACWPEKTCWVDSTRNPCIDLDPLPIVTFPPRGVYRDEMIAALEAVGRRWHISFTSSSLSGLQSAIADGMGIGLLPLRAVSAGHAVLPKNAGLPAVDVFEVALLHRPAADPMVKALARVLSRVLAEDTRSRPSFEK
ncbi:LysR family transcriptional regulator [Pseudomonas aeruginosa]|uniref:LysR family transcriptional regulator n=1 Tax=Pseudomonas aeruginosa TaxID=287 RepID=UPI00044B9F47|nr:LysR family transcriptional regulator [Pseudomonas aeruginosa]KAJ15668.1 LysR family transcriptional regulator [Pseudomonas aeruginosa IGB83]MBH8738236.1 LysR family transcriptional regulator [Pseudomonas aeruginosa]TRM18835.1 LysR family transcriptional regulator [Pseudomonas aeruginosa]HDQ4521752.1 LysR family transcriptional regulator [Pseudomonas aeruginosa]HDQ4523512.1 LysR family transcriptional regulator [Pseudomonas aeruginosa]